MRALRGTLLATLLSMTVLAGCFGGSDDALIEDDALTPVRDRHTLPFVTDEGWSKTLSEGVYEVLPGRGVFFDVEVPLGEGLPTQTAHMGLFLPDMDGCDWEATELPQECQVPVVADIGPYYGEPVLGDLHATEPANRLGRFLIENLVPHGYAVAQVSVLGTGDAGGCMDLMGEVEQAGVQAAVDVLGSAPWSNGAVALTGRSYDGSTPWEAAMVDSPYLKTVVPISGLYGQYDLMWRNGSAEDRGPGVLWGLYYAFTYTGNDPATQYVATEEAQADPERSLLQAQQIAENLVCPDTQAGAVHGVQAYATGDPGAVGYWEERSFKDEVLANYQGSVYFIHGMQDWNVDPHMAFPFYQELEAKGLEMKGLFGQWAHNYPDRLSEHESCDGRSALCKAPHSVRYDWAQDLLEWFDHYLKGTGPQPELHVEIQDGHGYWRIEESWPPLDGDQVVLTLDQFEKIAGNDLDVVAPSHVLAGLFPLGTDDGDTVLEVGPFEEDLRIAGLPTLPLTVTPTGPGGQLYAELRDKDADRHLTHAVMDLRFHAGGTDMQTVVPGQPIVAQMEFFPVDDVLPAGHVLELRLQNTGWNYVQSAVTAPVQVHLDDASALRIPTVHRTQEAFFTPPGTAWPTTLTLPTE